MWTKLAFASLFFLSACIPLPVPWGRDRSGDTPALKGTVQYGEASWYGDKEHGNKAASGEKFNRYALTAAHKALPFDTVVRVVNLENGKHVTVRINDRGPFVKGRIIDLSYAAGKAIGLDKSGVAEVRIEVLSHKSQRSGSLLHPVYTVQVGSYGDRKNARDVRKRVSRIVPDKARVETHNSDRGTYYRVRVGHFDNREEAEKVYRTLRKRGYKASIFVE